MIFVLIGFFNLGQLEALPLTDKVTINHYLEIKNNPLPKPEDMFATLSGFDLLQTY